MTRAACMMALLLVAATCNFDAALRRYCDNNPHCPAGAGGAGGAAQGRDGGDAQGLPPIPPPRNCGPYNACPYPNQVCHPFGSVCMQTCNTSADCPSWLDTCTEIRDPNGTVWTPKVCTCTSAQICNNYADGFTCSPVDSLCERLCATTPDCYPFYPPRVCDQLSGLCRVSTTPCNSNLDCPTAAQPHCDPVILRCTGCASFYDCNGRPDGRTQCGSTGACVSP